MGRGQGDGDIGTRMVRGDVWDEDAGTSNTGTRGRQIGTQGDPGDILFEYLKQERVSWRAKVVLNSF